MFHDSLACRRLMTAVECSWQHGARICRTNRPRPLEMEARVESDVCDIRLQHGITVEYWKVRIRSFSKIVDDPLVTEGFEHISTIVRQASNDLVTLGTLGIGRGIGMNLFDFEVLRVIEAAWSNCQITNIDDTPPVRVFLDHHILHGVSIDVWLSQAIAETNQPDIYRTKSTNLGRVAFSRPERLVAMSL